VEKKSQNGPNVKENETHGPKKTDSEVDVDAWISVLVMRIKVGGGDRSSSSSSWAFIIHSKIIQDRQMSSSISQKLWVDGRKCCPIIGRQEESNGGRVMSSSLSSTNFF
jgi:hypothetical protein